MPADPQPDFRRFLDAIWFREPDRVPIAELAMGTPQQVDEQVRRRIADLAPGGGYAVGISPGPAYYIRMENYDALRQAVFKYGRYPITVR